MGGQVPKQQRLLAVTQQVRRAFYSAIHDAGPPRHQARFGVRLGVRGLRSGSDGFRCRFAIEPRTRKECDKSVE